MVVLEVKRIIAERHKSIKHIKKSQKHGMVVGRRRTRPEVDWIEGDSIHFVFEISNGEFTVTEIYPASSEDMSKEMDRSHAAETHEGADHD